MHTYIQTDMHTHTHTHLTLIQCQWKLEVLMLVGQERRLFMYTAVEGRGVLLFVSAWARAAFLKVMRTPRKGSKRMVTMKMVMMF